MERGNEESHRQNKSSPRSEEEAQEEKEEEEEEDEEEKQEEEEKDKQDSQKEREEKEGKETQKKRRTRTRKKKSEANDKMNTTTKRSKKFCIAVSQQPLSTTDHGLGLGGTSGQGGEGPFGGRLKSYPLLQPHSAPEIHEERSEVTAVMDDTAVIVYFLIHSGKFPGMFVARETGKEMKKGALSDTGVPSARRLAFPSPLHFTGNSF
ncbi:hypothetical protein O3P69_017881 [Scylla paramamosain]|uniref:Uncharacterized protein n=1 Tax=Scylla paramamosain TaxID=85552 RepID=A0AAW0THX1_SCYPA